MALIPAADRANLQPILFEKYLNHQDNIAGTLSIRLVEARSLRAAASMFWVRTCNPYVIFRHGDQNLRSSTIQSNDNPSWHRELLEMKIQKLDLKRNPLDEHSDVRLELTIDVMNEDTITDRATKVVGLNNGSVIGTAVVDFTSLIEGKEEVMDKWVTLSGAIPFASSGSWKGGQQKRAPEKELMLGEVRIILQYEANGMVAMVGDTVKMEGFGAYPSSLLAPLEDLEFYVKKISGSYLLCSYLTKSGFEGTLRLHRNNVFVSHRGSLFDRMYVTCITNPLEYVGNTRVGKSCRDISRPYVAFVMALGLPAVLATRATRITITTTLRASAAAMRSVVSG